MACPRIPKGKTREAIERTKETGNEHAYVKCGDGSVSTVIEGSKSKLDITPALSQCDVSDGNVHVVHTHPSGNPQLSHIDREFGAKNDDVRSVCVATTTGKVRCESFDACDLEVSL